MSADEKSAVVADLGWQVRRVSSLAVTSDIATPATWHAPSLVEAARPTVLPGRLMAQIADYVAGTDEGDEVFLHGDLDVSSPLGGRRRACRHHRLGRRGCD